MDYVTCSVKTLPPDMLIPAAHAAIRNNPANAPVVFPGDTPSQERLAVLTGKMWPATGITLTVSFLDSSPADLQARIVQHMNAWGQYANVKFSLVPSGGQIRIDRKADGYWSYLGQDNLHIPANQQTMNLQGFTMNTPESEFHRVVRHETGHVLGFPHEQQLPEIVQLLDVSKTIAWGAQALGWDEATVRAQILTPLSPGSYRMTAHADQNGIMCYGLPAQITKNGVAIPGGVDIDAIDGAYAGSLYPLAVNPPPPPPPGGNCDCAQAVLTLVRAFNNVRPRGNQPSGALMNQPTFTDAERQQMAAVGTGICQNLGTLPWLKILQALLAACPAQATGAGPCNGLKTLLGLLCPTTP